jgi:hypothetical protein
MKRDRLKFRIAAGAIVRFRASSFSARRLSQQRQGWQKL